MVRKLIWLFVGYVVLRTVAPDLAAVMVGILIASLVTAIKLAGAGVAYIVAQVSGQDVSNATASALLTLVIVAMLWAWKPLTSRIRKLS